MLFKVYDLVGGFINTILNITCPFNIFYTNLFIFIHTRNYCCVCLFLLYIFFHKTIPYTILMFPWYFFSLWRVKSCQLSVKWIPLCYHPKINPANYLQNGYPNVITPKLIFLLKYYPQFIYLYKNFRG